LLFFFSSLVEMMHDLLQISLAPTVPASLRNIPTKYNIIIRMWTHGFHKLLESLRRAAFSGSEIALEHLQEFIYYSYVFYTHLYEEHTLRAFRSGWLEALGDLARYRMAVAALVTGTAATSQVLTAAALGAPADPSQTKAKTSSVNSLPVARIDDSPSPSVGVAAARQMNVEPEKERWRIAARGWYAAGLADTPGTGKLHHHLGLLSRDAEGEELRAVYHFVKR
jgi:protein SMG6